MILTPRQLQTWLDEGRTFRVLDLRPAAEREARPLAGLDALPADRGRPLPPADEPTLLVCEVGIVTEDLIRDRGLEDTWSLLGGAQAWDAFVRERTDWSRWSRQTALPEFGLEGQLRLGSATVAVVGLGGLGCPAAQVLAAAGVGRLLLVDGDRVELSNLHRQVLYGEGDVGRPKVEAAADRLRERGGPLEVTAVERTVGEEDAAELLAGADLVLDATDNPAARRALDAATRALGIPLVHGALYRFEGRVAVLNHAGGPSYADLFPDEDHRAGTCAEAGVLGMLPGIVGNIQALEAVKIIAGIEPNLSGRLLVYDGLSHATTVFGPGGGDGT